MVSSCRNLTVAELQIGLSVADPLAVVSAIRPASSCSDPLLIAIPDLLLYCPSLVGVLQPETHSSLCTSPKPSVQADKAAGSGTVEGVDGLCGLVSEGKHPSSPILSSNPSVGQDQGVCIVPQF